MTKYLNAISCSVWVFVYCRNISASLAVLFALVVLLNMQEEIIKDIQKFNKRKTENGET